MLTLKDLSEYDVESINVANIKNYLLHRKDILANIVLIVVALFIIGNIAKTRKAEIGNLKSEIDTLTTKVAAVAEYEEAKENVKAFYKSLPEGVGMADNLVNVVNELAILRNVEISSFSPSVKKSTSFSNITNMQLDISAPSYEDVGLFIEDIESSGNNLRIESWDIGRSRSRRGAAASVDKISARIEIAAINFTEWK